MTGGLPSAARGQTCGVRQWLVLMCLMLALPATANGTAVTFQANALHDGNAGNAGIAPPLHRAWTARVDGQPSYAVIAGGRVFVIVERHSLSSPGPVELLALSARSGAVLWRQALGSVYYAGLAYDGGRVFVSRSTSVEPGGLTAFDASNGAMAWQTEAGSSSGDPPVADGGVVYVRVGVNGGWFTARRQSDGAELWQRVFDNGTDGALAVTGDAVYAALPCGETVRMRRDDGQTVWTTPRNCAGGGGRTAVVGAGRAWGEDPAHSPHLQAYDLGAGTPREHWPATLTPAFAGSIGLFANGARGDERVYFGHTLTARDVPTGRTRWRFRGDGYLDTPPLVAGRTVYVGSGSGRLYGIALRSGRRVWRADVGAPVRGEAQPGPLGGLAAADGLLVAPAYGKVVAFR
jgi:outer membrane protein assembly factor BamB